MNFQALKDALAGLSDLSDEDAAKALALKTVPTTVSRMCNERTLYTELGQEMAESILQKIAAYTPLARVNSWLAPNQAGIDIGHPRSIAMIEQLVAGGILTQAEGDAVKGLAIVQTPFFESIGLTVLHSGDIAYVRAGGTF
jgi:hypothetical protein